MLQFHLQMDRLYLRHPYAAPVIMFITAPIAAIFTVFASAAAIMLPAALLLGWL